MRLAAFCLALFPTALFAEDIPLVSEVTAVTLYPGGATVTRQVPYSAPAGQHQLLLTDLPKSTPLGSVRVEVTGATLGSVTARQNFVPPRTEGENSAVTAAEAEVERLEIALIKANNNIQAIRLEADAARARIAFLEQLGKGDSVAQLDVAALRDLTEMIGGETLAALQTAHAAKLRAIEESRALEDLEQELADARKVLAALVPEVEDRAMLSVSVRSASPAEGVVTISYPIYQASWNPVYDLRLTRDTGQLQIERAAWVSQSTGENWTDVDLTLSTIRPADQIAPTEVYAWLRSIEDPVELRRKQTISSESAEFYANAVAEPAVLVEEAVPAASYDGIAVTYSYPDKVSVASGADHLRLSLGKAETTTTVFAQAVPLFDEQAFLMAGLTNDLGELLLPGYAQLYLDGRYVGETGIDLLPAGGEADLSFGPIDGLRLTRTVLDRNEGDRGVISRSNEITEAVRIEVENMTGETWPVRLFDRVPYSEQEDLEIDWTANPHPAETDFDGKRGVLAWEFDLPSGGRKDIALNHLIEWPDGMELR